MFVQVESSMIPGIIVINAFLFISTLALLSVAGRVLYLAIQRLLSSEPLPTPRAFVFFGSQLGYYAACLLLANFINCIAGLLGLPWLLNRGITEGSLCTTQAILMQFGNISTGYFTAAIAVHSFNSLVLRRRQSALMCTIYIAAGWSIAGAISIAPEFAISPRPYGVYWLSCAVKQDQPFLAFLLHLLPIFVASLISALLYSLVFLALRGTLRVKGGVKLQLNPEKRFYQKGEEYQAFVASLAQTMLWFPVAYVVLLVPYSVTRLLMASQTILVNIPFPVIVVSYCFWFLLGAVNVFILYKTFRILTPAIDGKLTSTKDVESFAATKNIQWSMVNPENVNPGPILAEKIGSPETETIGRPILKPLALSRIHERNFSTGSVESTSSSRGLLASYQSQTILSPAQARVIDSPHSRQGSMDRALSPALTRVISSPHLRQVSFDRTPSPSQARIASPMSVLSSSHSRQTSFDRPGLPAAPRPSNRVVPATRTSSLPPDAGELDIAGWLEEHVQGRGPHTGARLSAVTETTDFHPPATASTMLSPPEPSPLAPMPAIPVPILDPAPRFRRHQGQW